VDSQQSSLTNLSKEISDDRSIRHIISLLDEFSLVTALASLVSCASGFQTVCTPATFPTMALRRPPRIAECSSIDWGSDFDGPDDDDLSAAFQAIKPPPRAGSLPTTSPAIHPFLTDFGSDSLQEFLRKGIEEAKAGGRDVSGSKGKEKADKKIQPHRTSRPGFQRPLSIDRVWSRARNVTRRDSERVEDDTAVEGDDEFMPTRVRQRPQREKRVDSDDSDDSDMSSTSKSAKATTLSRGKLVADKLVRKQNTDNALLSPQIPRNAASGRRARQADRAEIEDDATSLHHYPLQRPAGVKKSGEIQRKESRTQPEKLANTAKQTDAAIGTISEQEQYPNQVQACEAFQREEMHLIPLVPFENTNDNHDEFHLRRNVESRRSSRNVDFEEHVSAKRQSWREDENIFPKNFRPVRAADIDDDSRRVRKSPSRNTGAPNFTEDSHFGAASSSVPLSNTSDIPAALDRIQDPVSAFAPLNRLTSSPTIAVQGAQPRRSPWAAQRGFRDRLTRRYSTMEVSDDSDEWPLSIHNNDNIFSRSLPRHVLASSPTTSLKRSPGDLSAFEQLSPARFIKETPLAFDYAQIVPETLPKETLRLGPRGSAKIVTGVKGHKNELGRQMIERDSFTTFPSQRKSTLSGTKPWDQENFQQHPRVWDAVDLPAHPSDPPSCPLNMAGIGWPDGLSAEMFTNICKFLSHEDVRNLRLVSKAFASAITPILFRSVVTSFGRSMFDINKTNWDGKNNVLPSYSLFKQLGEHINKFGIAFEVDLHSLQFARSKIIQRQEESWWGDYVWPIPNYPRFPALQSIEDLVDDNAPLLRDVLEHLSRTSELGLSIDSGHGWLNGPDLSDLEIYNMRCERGSRVFKKAFLGENKWQEHGRSELIKWGQQNTLNEAIKAMHRDHQYGQDRSSELQFLKLVVVRDYASFKDPATQPDRDAHSHTGGRTLNVHLPQALPPALANIQQLGQMPNNFGQHHHQQHHYQQQQHQHQHRHQHQHQHQNYHQNQLLHILQNPNLQDHRTAVNIRRRGTQPPRRAQRTPSQWPIIFNGHNIAAEVGGDSNFIQSKIASPQSFPLRPGDLTEAQAQWLMETVWAQRAFLSAYTTAIIMNKANLTAVHSLHIAKLSSGLLPSLAQCEFWSALPGLKTLKIIISADWRTEHTPGDRAYNNNMLISPIQASTKFAEFLQEHIARIEHLSALTVGFIDGGEHAPGIYARNQNILPAPVTSHPRAWLSDQKGKPDMNTIMKFDHIRELAFENCWFSPCMLESFMEKSRDTSLRHLILNSVSLTGVHSSRNDGPLTTSDNNLRPQFGREEWLQERLPSEGCWPGVLDRLTPGVTFFERKAAAGMIETERMENPEKREFRGNVEKITLKSVGYVKISGVPGTEFNQNGLVVSSRNPMDEGLKARKTLLEMDGGERGDSSRRRVVRLANNIAMAVHGHGQYGNIGLPPPHGAIAALQNAVTSRDMSVAGRRVMMSRNDPETGSEYFGLGKLTQCVHPIEKRVLEGAWGMEFGWGDAMERWAAVEDGWFEGGTGRFSGIVSK
jgi:hypothetical protein